MHITLEQLNKKSDEYKKFKDQQQTKANAFNKQHIFYIYANTDDSFQEQVEQLGCNIDDIADLGAGAYCSKKDYEKVNNFLDELVAETQSYITDADNFYGAFYYELWNHEYYISMDKDAVAGALGLDASDIINKYPLVDKVIEFYIVEFERLNL